MEGGALSGGCGVWSPNWHAGEQIRRMTQLMCERRKRVRKYSDGSFNPLHGSEKCYAMHVLGWSLDLRDKVKIS